MPFKPESTKYMLKSLICHHGETLNSGHYSAYISANNMWYHIDDRICTPVNEKNLFSDKAIKKGAYLIVYEQKE